MKPKYKYNYKCFFGMWDYLCLLGKFLRTLNYAKSMELNVVSVRDMIFSDVENWQRDRLSGIKF